MAFHEMSKDEFIDTLIKAGWSREEAEKEWDDQINGPAGDCDGDLEPN